MISMDILSGKDKPSVAQVASFHFTEYVDKFDEISRLLLYEIVVSGDFEKTFANISSLLEKEPAKVKR